MLEVFKLIFEYSKEIVGSPFLSRFKSVNDICICCSLKEVFIVFKFFSSGISYSLSTKAINKLYL